MRETVAGSVQSFVMPSLHMLVCATAWRTLRFFAHSWHSIMDDFKKTASEWGNWFVAKAEVAGQEIEVAAEKAAKAANEKANGNRMPPRF